MQTKNTFDMSVKKEILQEIKKWDKIIILRHQRPDPDALGSQAGLGELIKTNFPHKQVLYGGEIPLGLHFMVEPEKVSRADFEDALVIVVDTANTPRIDGGELIGKNKLIKIDHHPKVDSYGDIEWVNTSASSCSEMIADFFFSFDQLKLSDQGAELLYSGIVGDTGRFQFDNTKPYTMQVAAELMKYDFNAAHLHSKFGELTEKEAKLLGFAYTHVQTLEGGVAYLTLTQDLLQEFDLMDQETGSVVGVPGRLEGIYSWVIFIQQEDGSYRCRIRSKGPIINELAQEHHGGGHPKASGANAYSDRERQEILEKLVKVTLEWKNNLSA